MLVVETCLDDMEAMLFNCDFQGRNAQPRHRASEESTLLANRAANLKKDREELTCVFVVAFVGVRIVVIVAGSVVC